MKRTIAGLAAAVVLAACSAKKPTVVDPRAWAEGTWVSVRMNGQPLPYRDSNTYPYFQSDSLELIVIGIGGTYTTGVFPSETLHFAANLAPDPILCWETFAPTTVTATTLSTRAAGVLTNGGGCNSSLVAFDFTRAGDSLAGVWNGVGVRLVRR